VKHTAHSSDIVNPMPERLDDLTASFRRDLRAEGKSPRTIVLYAMSVRLFSEWLDSHERQPILDELTRTAIRGWLADLAETKAPGTVRTRWRGLHRFCVWLVREELLSDNPMSGLTPPDAPAPHVPVLTDDELSALIKACEGKRWYDRRDEAVIRLLLDCGVRVSELCGLRVADVDLDREMALVTGKGSRLRPVYFGARTSRALDRWLRERRRHRWRHCEAFFLGERGPLTPDGVRELVKVRGNAAGIRDRIHPHRFRHTFAHDYLLNGGQGPDLKRLAGWTSDVMLERYGASGADVRARAAAKRLRRGDRV
jgi:site-specific recombinase XerD